MIEVLLAFERPHREGGAYVRTFKFPTVGEALQFFATATKAADAMGGLLPFGPVLTLQVDHVPDEDA